MAVFSSVTVITAVRNNPDGLRKLQESIALRDVEIEWVIVDDNGKSVRELTEACAPVIFEKKTTIYEAFNLGVAAASSSHVIFVGSDDFLLSGFDSMVKSMLGLDIDVVCALPRGQYASDGLAIDELLLNNYCQQGLIYDRELVLKYGFNTRYTIAADYLLNLQVANNQDLKVESHFAEIVHFSDGGISSTAWDTLFHVEWHKHKKLIPKIASSPNFNKCIGRMKNARLIRLSEQGFDWPSFSSMVMSPPCRHDLAAFIQGSKRRLF